MDIEIFLLFFFKILMISEIISRKILSEPLQEKKERIVLQKYLSSPRWKNNIKSKT